MAHYLIIGSGRTAKHFAHYFQLLALHFETWNRHEPWALLQTRLERATHVLLLISDSALESFYQQNLKQLDRVYIHCSGAMEIAGIQSAHPLMTFSETLYDLPTYQSIPFILTSTQKISDLLPGLSNPTYQISPEQKAYYHSLCVMSGNFTILLWQKMSQGLQELGFPQSAALPYMKQIFANLENNLAGALTGPLARKDLKTVQNNLNALKDDSFQKIYQAFAEVFFPEAFPHSNPSKKESAHKGNQS
jgi:predicted short-subunit dehydrogenase-like oxidoreductase (DUF2520 family)